MRYKSDFINVLRKYCVDNIYSFGYLRDQLLHSLEYHRYVIHTEKSNCEVIPVSARVEAINLIVVGFAKDHSLTSVFKEQRFPKRVFKFCHRHSSEADPIVDSIHG